MSCWRWWLSFRSTLSIYFAWRAAQEPSYAQYAIANMTGANRLLVGVGWAAVVFLFWWRTRIRGVDLAEHESLEIGVLAIATLYAFTIPLKGTLSILDAAILLVLFGVYAYASYRQPPEDPLLVGPAATIGALPVGRRRLVPAGLFLFAAIAILLSAEPFAEGLVETGHRLHIDEFLLVQWLAPLASEAPEFIVALLFVTRGHPHLGLRTMVSSKVNQWTLLIGTLPLVYAISAGRLVPLVLDQRQLEEVLLTASQSALAVVLIAGLGLSAVSAISLFVLFIVQLLFPDIRLVVSGVYLALTVAILAIDRRRTTRIGRGVARLLSSGSA